MESGRNLHSLQQTRGTSVRILLGIQDTPGAPVNASDVDQLATIGIGVTTVRQVLDAARMLHEDRTPVIERWFTHRTTGLPEPMRAELAVWFDIMRNGSTAAPRRRPRAAATIYAQLDFAMPALRAWAANHESLREISREDFLAILPPAGTPRATLIGGCRSVLQVLKGRRHVFVDPTRGVRGAMAETRLPLPVDVATLRQLVNSDDVIVAAIAALLAFHGLRSGQVVKLLLTDIRDGRLLLGSRTILLAPAALAKVDAWLDHRTRRWPNTANPHLFINFKTAVHTGPIGTWGIGKKLGISAKGHSRGPHPRRGHRHRRRRPPHLRPVRTVRHSGHPLHQGARPTDDDRVRARPPRPALNRRLPLDTHSGSGSWSIEDGSAMTAR